MPDASKPSPMALALAAARAAGTRGDVPIGAVIVGSTGEVLAEAGNRTEELDDPTAHAEMLAIRAVVARLGVPRVVDCDLYVTLEPCPMCAQAIAFARIRRLYWGGRPIPRAAASNTVRGPTETIVAAAALQSEDSSRSSASSASSSENFTATTSCSAWLIIVCSSSSIRSICSAMTFTLSLVNHASPLPRRKSGVENQAPQRPFPPRGRKLYLSRRCR